MDADLRWDICRSQSKVELSLPVYMCACLHIGSELRTFGKNSGEVHKQVGGSFVFRK